MMENNGGPDPLKTADWVLKWLHDRKSGDIEAIAFETIMTQGGSIEVKDGGAMFTFYDGSAMYIKGGRISICYGADSPEPVKWTGEKSVWDWHEVYKVYPQTRLAVEEDE